MLLGRLNIRSLEVPRNMSDCPEKALICWSAGTIPLTTRYCITIDFPAFLNFAKAALEDLALRMVGTD